MDDEKNMKRMHELICVMELDAKNLAKELLEKLGWGLSPRQVSLYVGGVSKGRDLHDFVDRLEKLLQMRREALVHTSAKTMSDVIRAWKKKLGDAGVDDKVTSITFILESSGIPACRFGSYLARDKKPNPKLLTRMEAAITAALALSARPAPSKSFH